MLKRNALFCAILAASTAQAQIQEVIVTATKQEASTQDIPVAVSALGEEALEQLGITDFTDYMIQMPGVTAGGAGPGQNTIYIRGLASTTPNLTTAGVAGLSPNVALYLDEQPLSYPGRNLDVYAADLNRIEVLKGPQGTLFGASSQAGTVRLITNKPDSSGFASNIKLGAAHTRGGETSKNIELMVNVPVSDTLTLRGVAYRDSQGGYIDNVNGSLTAAESIVFEGDDLTGLTDNWASANNTAEVEENFNDVTYTGSRLSGLYQINDDWSALVSLAQQTIDSEGVFFADPTLGEDDLKIRRYEDDRIEDEFTNASWTLEGRLGMLDMIYTGAFTDRESAQRIDYTDYLFVGKYVPYYICDSGAGDPSAASAVCGAPNMYVDSQVGTKIKTHELRFSTDQDAAIRATFGGFYSDLELEEANSFVYRGSLTQNFPSNRPFMTGHTTNSGPFGPGTIFKNDILRTDEQLGLFAELTVDLSDSLSATFGARWYDIEIDLNGSANGSFCNKNETEDKNAYGTDITDLYNGDGSFTFLGTCSPKTFTAGVSDDPQDPNYNAEFDTLTAAQQELVRSSLAAPDTAQTDGVIGKFTLAWTPNTDSLFYATWSQGFRPGLLNRPGGQSSKEANSTYKVPFAPDSDDVTNYELGWKLDLLDGNLRFNGDIFYVDIEDLQVSIFDTTIVNLFFAENAADAEIKGVEGDFIWLPSSVAGLTISGGFSVLDTEVTKNHVGNTNYIKVGDELAFAPELQLNLQARYEWSLSNGDTAHVMPHVSYSDEATTDIVRPNQTTLDSWTLIGVTAGVSNDEWTAELYIDNLSDERAQISGNAVFNKDRIMVVRPRTVGLRFSYDI